MKPLTAEQIKSLVCSIGHTADCEYNCTECHQRVGEFAERQLAGLPLDEALAAVQQHLAICPECLEEFQALEKILRESKE